MRSGTLLGRFLRIVLPTFDNAREIRNLNIFLSILLFKTSCCSLDVYSYSYLSIYSIYIIILILVPFYLLCLDI